MNRILCCLLLLLGSPAVLGQGTILFNNRIVGVIDAPVRDTDGSLLNGPAYVGQLYASAVGGTLAAVGAPIPFRSGTGAGYLNITGVDTTRTVPGVQPQGVARLQMVAWEVARGATFEAALANGGKTGSSAVIQVTTGGGLVPPAQMLGLQGFQLQLASPPTISVQPVAVVTGLGGTARFEVVATGAPPLSYQWRKGAANIPGATSASYQITSVAAGDAASYSVRVTNPFGFRDSSAVNLTIAPLPTIDRVIVTPNPPLVGRSLRLEVVVTGTGPFTYQWLLNGNALAGMTGTAYETTSAQAGLYAVRVTGPGGSITRDAATVTALYTLDLVQGRGGSATATPAQASYTSGAQVTLRATAEAGYEFGGWTGDFVSTANPATLVMDGHKRVEASFRATAGTIQFVNRNVGTGLDAPVFETDGVTRLAGPAYLAQLYAGASEAALVPAGPPVPFRTEAGAAGYFVPEDRAIPGVTGGGRAFIQIRAWRAADGATYEAALAAPNGRTGSGNIVSILTGNAGSPPSLPALPAGWTRFNLQTGGPARIIDQPVAVAVGLGGSAKFEVKAGGTTPLTYQWKKGANNIPGATSAIYQIPNVAAGDAGNYSVRVSNAQGFVDSAVVTLTIVPLPAITGVVITPNPPLVGRALHLEVQVSGTGPFTYQWLLNNTPIAGATAAVLDRAAAEPGVYSVRVTNLAGTTPRDVVTVVAQYILDLVQGRGGSATATPAQGSYASGTPVTLRATAEAGYEFGGWTGDFVSTANPATLVMDGHKRVEASFRATAGTIQFVNRNVGTGLDAPVFETDGVTRLAGPAYLAQLYAGASEAALVPAGPPVPFRTEAGAAGYFVPEDRAIPGVTGGGRAFIQIRAWRAADGATYEAALAAPNGRTGSGNIVSILTGNAGSPPSLPALPAGWTRFNLQTGGPARIIDQPVAVAVGLGGSAKFEVKAGGTTPLTYQWKKGANNIPGATSAIYQIPNVAAGDAGNYSVRVSNAQGFVDSAVVTLTIVPLPAITGVVITPNPPLVGRALHLEVQVSGTGPFTYQWLLNNTPIAGATAAFLDRVAAEAGQYSVRVTGPGGTASRDVALATTDYILDLVQGRGGRATATPALAAYPNGTSVTLEATPEPGYVFGGWIGDVTSTVNPLTFRMVTHRRIEASFRPTAGTIVFVNRNLGLGLNAPAFETDGTTALFGPNYVAQLYAGPAENQLAPVGAPVPFRTADGAGYFPSEDRSIPTVVPGGRAFVQIRAWRVSDGATYEAAEAANGHVGAGNVVSVVTGNVGSPPSLPATPTGWTRFNLQIGAPRYALELAPGNGGSITAVPREASYAPGTAVTLSAVPEPGYEFGGWAGDLAGTVNPSALVMNARKRVEAAFRPTHGTVLFANLNAGLGLDARVFDQDGTTPVTGPAVVAQLYGGPSADALLPVGQPVPFRTGDAAGYIVGVERSIPTVAKGGAAFIQFRAWLPAQGATYEDAVQAGGRVGSSDVLRVVTGNAGSPPSLPPFPVGWNSFKLQIGSPPRILAGPASATGVLGRPFELRVVAEGNPAPLYEWRRNGVPIPGATAAVLSFAALQLTDAAGYSVRVYNAFGQVVSGTADLLVVVPPHITAVTSTSPIFAGERARLEVVATGTAPLAYAWYAGVPPDASLPVGLGQAVFNSDPLLANASFWARVSNTGGSVTSSVFQVVVNRRSQTIAFNPAGPLVFGAGPVTLSANASSGLPVAFSVVSGPGVLAGNLLTPRGAGTIVVRAQQGGDQIFLPAPVVERSIVVQPAPATVVLSGLDQVYDGTPRVIGASTVPPGLAVDLTYNGTPAAPVNAGSYAVAGTIRDPNYTGVANGSLVVAKAAQTIVFSPPADATFGGAPLVLAASASSGLPVTLLRVSGPAVLVGNVLTLTGAGTVTVSANQPGDANRMAAPEVVRSITVRKAVATVSLAALDQRFDGTPKQPTVSVSPQGLLVKLTYNGSPTPPSAEGDYAVLATVDDPNYQGSAAGTLRIQAVVNIAGAVFNDLDSDGQRGAVENGLANVTVRLLGLDGTTVLRTVITDPTGAFALKGVAAGSYYLAEENPPGFTSTTPDLRLIAVQPDTVTEVSFGDQPVGAVAGFVFEDVNGDGSRDASERGIPDVQIRLAGATGSQTQRTSADGGFRFTGVNPGSYTLEETDPSGFSSTTPNLRTVSVAPGGSANANFGDQPAGSIVGLVFVDGNGNGFPEAGEPGLAGVQVRLTGPSGSLNRTTLGDGSFVFGGLAPGSYLVEETDPSGYSSTTPNSRTVSLASGGAAAAIFGDQPVGTVVGMVFEDKNGNGSPDAGEPGIGGVTVRLSGPGGDRTQLTAATGAFTFSGVIPGTYTLEETDPVGFVSTTPNARVVTLAAGGSTGANFGDQASGTVTGIVYEDIDGNGVRDPGEPGIGGVQVKLVGETGQRTTATSGDGAFLFAAVTPGSYTVEEIDPVGYSSSTPNLRAVSVASAGAASASFGDQAAGTVAGSVYDDLNGNASQDPGEPGLGGVVIRLSGVTGQRTATTSGDGVYQFSGVVPGTYAVEEIDPVGFFSTSPNLRTVSLSSGGSANASFGDQAAGTVSGIVFQDANGNGSQEPGESGIGGVLVRLIDSVAQRSTRTTGDGSYLFSGITPGGYTVEETDPVGYSSTTPNLRNVILASGGAASASFGDQASGTVAGIVYSDANGNGSHDPGESGIGGVAIRLVGALGQLSTTTAGDGTYRFPLLNPGLYTVEETDPSGFASTTPNIRAVSLASAGAASASFGDQPVETISGIVYQDLNGNGRPDFGEPGIGGVQMRLLLAADASLVRETVTSGDGLYVFADVPSGSYQVRQAVPSSYTVLASSGGAPPPAPGLHGAGSAPGFIDKSVQLAEGGSATASFGMNVVGQITGVAFDDLDGNGTPSQGEPGLGGADLDVRNLETGALLGTFRTSGSGIYQVPSLPAGTYEISQKSISGYFTPIPRVTITLASGGAATANFANRVGATVSGLVFNDENGNGQRDGAEPGMGGIKVVLSRAGSANIEATTAGDGSFLFFGIAAGNFRLQQTPPSGFHATSPAALDLLLSAGAAVGASFGNQSDSVRPPSITTEPSDQFLAEGLPGQLAVVALGTAPLEYQWLKDGTPIPGATAAVLDFPSARNTDAGIYQLRIRNPVGTALSRAARVTVATSDPFASWLAGKNVPAALRRPTDDPDADLLPNLLEFVLGTIPTAPDEAGLIQGVQFTRDGRPYLGFAFNRAREASSVRLALEASDDLLRWTEVSATVDTLLTGATADRIQILDTQPMTTGSHRFLRLVAHRGSTLASPAKLTILSAPPIAASFRISIEGTPGTTYAIERATELGTWSFLENVTAGSTPVIVTDADVSSSRYRFYRAVAR